MCKYCSVLVDCETSGIPLSITYKIKDLISFIDRTQKDRNDPQVDIYFFGGEPTLEFSLMQKNITEFKNCLTNYNVNIILHTNGLLLNKLPQTTLNLIDLIIISINYDEIPQFNLGKGYFKTIINNVSKIKSEKNINVIARLTITEKTSLYTVALQTQNFFDYVYWQIINTEAFLHFDDFYESYKFEIEITFNYWLNHFKEGNLIKLVPFMSAMKFLLYNDRNNNLFGCGYGHNMIYIQTNGDCFSCSDSIGTKTHFIGNIHTKIRFPSIKLGNFKCKNCLYRKICKGRCGRMHVEFDEKQTALYCKLNKVLYDLIITNKDEIQNAILKYPKLETQIKDSILNFTEFTS
jgi:radical SAM protein with 4Fe4S-binding SPASM domain